MHVPIARIASLTACSLLAAGLLGCSGDTFSDSTVRNSVTLSPANSVPPVVGPTSTGTAELLVDPSNGRVIIEGTFSGLSSAPLVIDGTGSAMHLHRAANAPFDQNVGGVVAAVDLRTDASRRAGTFFLTFVADAETLTAILNGETYLNLHTVNWGSGELRAQLTF